MVQGEPGEEITADIIDIVTMRAKQHGLSLDAEPLLRGIASAFVALAYNTHSHTQAKTLLLGLASALDDPPTHEWVQTHGKPS